MPTKNTGLRSDGELVQAVSEKLADAFDFVDLQRTAGHDGDHGGCIEILDVSAPLNRKAGDRDDDERPDTIIWRPRQAVPEMP